MGDQREQEQVETGLAICIPGMDVQLSNNENIIDQREKEGIESSSSKINKVNNGLKTPKDQKRGKFGWQASIFHSITQTRRTASITNKQINEQSCENNGLDKRNDSNEKMFDRAILVDDSIGEQQTKDDRQELEQNINFDKRINFRMESECDQEQHTNPKDLPTIRSGNGEFEPARDTGDIQSIEVENGCAFTIGHITEKQKKEANALSRLSMAGDYSIKKEVLEEVLKDWQVGITVHLFAARNNAKHKRYYTLGKDKNADGGDSKIVSWEEEFELIHQPIPIISRVIREIIEERTQGVIIVLDWPGQVWQTQLKENNREREVIGREREGIRDGIEDEKKESESPSGEDI
ncbi:MAG: hypothetical protein EZS28_047259, partial [Streblomastix strix]